MKETLEQQISQHREQHQKQVCRKKSVWFKSYIVCCGHKRSIGYLYQQVSK